MNVAIGVANALEYLHQHNICHGDVYAHNVLADSHGKSVLCDYGKHGSIDLNSPHVAGQMSNPAEILRLRVLVDGGPGSTLSPGVSAAQAVQHVLCPHLLMSLLFQYMCTQ